MPKFKLKIIRGFYEEQIIEAEDNNQAWEKGGDICDLADTADAGLYCMLENVFQVDDEGNRVEPLREMLFEAPDIAGPIPRVWEPIMDDVAVAIPAEAPQWDDGDGPR